MPAKARSLAEWDKIVDELSPDEDEAVAAKQVRDSVRKGTAASAAMIRTQDSRSSAPAGHGGKKGNKKRQRKATKRPVAAAVSTGRKVSSAADAAAVERELQQTMASVNIDEAREAVRQAEAMVRDLQSQQATAAATLQKDRVSTDAARERAATAKDLADRLKRGEEAEELSAAARAGGTDAPSYASETYWEDRYVAELEDAGGDTVAAATFEWYVGYDRLAPLLRGVCPSATTPAGCAATSVLVVGCGNSTLSEELYDDGYGRVSSFDISPTVVTTMTERKEERYSESKRARDGSGLEYFVGDGTSLQKHFQGWGSGGCFELAVDKGTIDAVMSESGMANMQAICREVMALLKPHGSFVIISSIPPEHYAPILIPFTFDPRDLGVHQFTRLDGEGDDGGPVGGHEDRVCYAYRLAKGPPPTGNASSTTATVLPPPPSPSAASDPVVQKKKAEIDKVNDEMADLMKTLEEVKKAAAFAKEQAAAQTKAVASAQKDLKNAEEKKKEIGEKVDESWKNMDTHIHQAVHEHGVGSVIDSVKDQTGVSLPEGADLSQLNDLMTQHGGSEPKSKLGSGKANAEQTEHQNGGGGTRNNGYVPVTPKEDERRVALTAVMVVGDNDSDGGGQRRKSKVALSKKAAAARAGKGHLTVSYTFEEGVEEKFGYDRDYIAVYKDSASLVRDYLAVQNGEVASAEPAIPTDVGDYLDFNYLDDTEVFNGEVKLSVTATAVNEAKLAAGAGAGKDSKGTGGSGLVVCFVNENGRVLDTVRVAVAVDKSATTTAVAAVADGKGAYEAGPPVPPAPVEEVTAPAKTSAPKASTPNASARAVAAPVPPGWKPMSYVLEQLTGLRCLQAFIPLSAAQGGDGGTGSMRVSGLHLQCSDAHATVAFTVDGVYHGVRLDAMNCGTRTPQGDSSRIVLTPSQCTATTEADHILLRVPYSTIGGAATTAASFSNPEDEEFAAATNGAGSGGEGGELYSIGCRFCGSEFVSEGAVAKTLAAPTGLLDDICEDVTCSDCSIMDLSSRSARVNAGSALVSDAAITIPADAVIRDALCIDPAAEGLYCAICTSRVGDAFILADDDTGANVNADVDMSFGSGQPDEDAKPLNNFAPMEMSDIRFHSHRIVTPGWSQLTAAHDGGSFVAMALVDAVQRQNCFVFRLRVRGEAIDGPSDRSISLKILSWTNSMALLGNGEEDGGAVRLQPVLKVGHRFQGPAEKASANGKAGEEGEGGPDMPTLFLEVADWMEVAELLRSNAAALPASLSRGTAGLHEEPGMALSLLKLPPSLALGN